MTIGLKNIVRALGAIFLVLGLVLILPLIVAIIYKEKTSFYSFLVVLLCCIIPGLIIIKLMPPSRIKIKKRDVFLIVTVAWLIVSAIGAIPFVSSGSIPSYVDAFFETSSGFTTTGATLLADVESLPKSMLFWRSFTHWLGGMGIIVFTTALLPSIGVQGQTIASAETPGPTLDKLTARYSDTSRNLYILYLGFTIAETILLLFGGMNLFDALTHSFSTVGTGGFSNYNNGLMHFTNPYIHWVIIIFMVICGTNFNLFFYAKRKGPKMFFKDEEFRLYIGIMLFVTVLAFIDLMSKGVYTNPFEGFTSAAFQTSSLMTTTGFATTDYNLWPTLSKMLLLIVFFTGASSSSTAGGVKVIRILVILKLIRRGISLKLHPKRVYTVKVNKVPLDDEVAEGICSFLFFFVAVLFIGTLLVAVDGFDLVTNFSATLTCIGNVGPGFNLVGPTSNFSIFSPFSKLVFSFIMIAGRLEIFTFFMLFSPKYWNSNKR